MMTSAASATTRGAVGSDDQNHRRSRAERMENAAKYSSMRKLNVVSTLPLAANPRRDQLNHKNSSVSTTISAPRTTDTITYPLMFHVSGFLDDRTWSAASAIFAKSVMKTRSSIANAETTNLPVSRYATATNDAFRIVRLILLRIHVRMR